VVGCIRPRINFQSDGLPAKKYVAEFEVQLLPTGEVGAIKVLRRSGLPAYDDAVERAIWQCKPFPLPPDGSRSVRLSFDPVETR
jgi:colicin import membrane protein